MEPETTSPETNSPKSGAGRKRSTNLELAKRIDEVLRLKLDGAQYHEIQQFASENRWNVTERQLREYMHRADELLKERSEKKHRKLAVLHRARLEALYARAIKTNDLRTALAVLQEQAKVQGLYVDEKVVRDLTRQFKELRRFMDPQFEQENQDSISALLNNLSTEDKAELAKQLRVRGYKPYSASSERTEPTTQETKSHDDE